MISAWSRSRVFAHAAPADLRKGFDGLAALVREQLKVEATSGDLYLFVSRDRTRAKVLWWDGTGLCVYAKRLEQGRLARISHQVLNRRYFCPAEVPSVGKDAKDWPG